MPGSNSGYGSPAPTGPPAAIVGRRAELQALDELIASVRDGMSVTLVVVGEPGVGKTTLLDHLASAAEGIVLRAGGVQPEQRLGYAALHRLLLPHLDRVGHLPGPQRDALLTVLGIVSGPSPEPFHVGLATLSLLADVAASCSAVLRGGRRRTGSIRNRWT